MTAAWDGVPQNPEREGWHWLVPAINPTLPPGAYRWHAPPRSDVVGMWEAGHPLDVVRRCYAYLGPCLTPAEHAAALAAARAEGRLAGMEEAAGIADQSSARCRRREGEQGMTYDLREAVARAIHEGLGGNGWAYSNYAMDEFRTQRDELNGAADAALAALGIPLATLAGLREGSLVAVPVEATEAMFMAAGDVPASNRPKYGLRIRIGDMAAAEAWRRMVAARPNATEAGHE